MSLCELLKNSPHNINMLLLVPLVRLDLAKNNIIFQASCIWNGLIKKLMNRSFTNSLGIIVTPVVILTFQHPIKIKLKMFFFLLKN